MFLCCILVNKLLCKSSTKTQMIGKDIKTLPKCRSTNETLAEMWRNGVVQEGTVIRANEQTAGRGQRNSLWESQPGMNLTFSLLIHPRYVPVGQQFFISMLTSLALHDVVASTLTEEVKIKWPNDILVEQRKVCGILIENFLQEKNIDTSIIGIGLNVNQTSFSYPQATSLALEKNRLLNREEIFFQLMERLNVRLSQLLHGEHEKLTDDYLTSLYGYEKLLRYEDVTNGQQFNGKITGVSQEGKLIIKHCHTQEMYCFGFKEVRFTGFKVQ